MSEIENSTRCPVCETAVGVAENLRWLKDGFEIVACPRCGLLFRARLPSAAELPAIYTMEYFAEVGAEGAGQGYADYLGEEDIHRLSARRRLRLLRRFGVAGPLLDVGCAGGFFLDEARRQGWSVEGVDVSEQMARFARDRLGLQVATGTFAELNANEPAYGCITMWDYIEHTLDPLAELRRARELLRGSGLLALSTGDASALVARVSGSRWHLLTPRHHNFFFTMATLRDALEQAGLEPVWTGHLGSRYTIRYLVHKLRTAAPGSTLLARADERLARARLGRVAVPLNLRDIVTVLARPTGAAPTTLGRP
jgi:SAM-dependent methyltransferase